MASIQLANAPCSWGILEFELDGPTQDAEAVMGEMRSAGFGATELGDWGFMPTDPSGLSDLLKRKHLELAGAFVPVALANPEKHDEGLKAALRTARLLAECGQRAVVVLADDDGANPTRTARAGRIRKEDGLARDGWANFTEGVNRIAQEIYGETGVQTVFHHHCAGYIETPWEIDYLLSKTDPSVLGLCLDTGHYAFGGGDPLKALKEYGERIRHVHFKDCAESLLEASREKGWDYFESLRQGVFCELGKGAVDFQGILSHLESRDYQGWIVVEQDILPGMGSPLENAKRNRSYLRSIGL